MCLQLSAKNKEKLLPQSASFEIAHFAGTPTRSASEEMTYSE
jgi:hypothetical protein